MNCYDCGTRQVVAPAVAICTSCGSGVCMDCLRTEQLEHGPAATPGNPLHHPTRRQLCNACDSALARAA